MKLSIIVAVYNAEAYISRCVESLLDQDVENYEIILINDGSKDKSLEIIKKYEAENPALIRVINKENTGVADTRNVGLKQARGTYVTYVDSDDFVVKDCYKEILETAQQYNSDIVFYDAYKQYSNRTEYFYGMKRADEGIVSSEEYILSLPCPWNKIMKKELFGKLGKMFPYGIWYEDFSVIPALGKVAENIYYLKKPFVYYYQSEESITRKKGFQEKWHDIFNACEILSDSLGTKYRTEMEYLYIFYLLIQSSIQYYQFQRYDLIDEISDVMRTKYPKWSRNPYFKQQGIRNKVLAHLFYRKQYRIIRWVQRVKHVKGV